MLFWDSYFEEQGAAVDFRLLNIDGRDCSIQEPDVTEDQGQSGETQAARETIQSPVSFRDTKLAAFRRSDASRR